MMKKRYYETELAYLREGGKEFAKRFPNTAGFLAERSDDPDVERLLEGVAFLAAQIRERAEDAFPQLGAQYASFLVPQLTRFVPSLATVQFHTEERGLRSVEVVPRGTQLAGTTPTGTRCLFQTTCEITVLPTELVEVRLDRPTSQTYRLFVRLRTPRHLVEATARHRIRLHLHGEIAFWTALRLWFSRYCTKAEVRHEGTVVGEFDPAAIETVGMGDDTNLLPEDPLQHDAFTRAAELLAYPEKFAYIDLPPLRRLAGADMELQFTFEDPPKLPRPPVVDDIKLHCVPVINLFQTSADPVRFDPLRPENRLRVANYLPSDAEVWSTIDVTSLSTQARTTYPSLAAFPFDGTKDTRFYSIRRAPSTHAIGTDVYLSLNSPRDARPIADTGVLSVEVWASNRDQATHLEIGALNQPVRGSVVPAPFSNITPVSPPLYPHEDTELLWRLAAHIGLSRRGLHEAVTLRRLLSLYNFADSSNSRRGRLNNLWIKSIREVITKTSVRVRRGAPVSGTHVTVVLDESMFGSMGEAFMLGEVLSDIFARRVPINSFSQLAIRMSPTGVSHSWAPRNGNHPLS